MKILEVNDYSLNDRNASGAENFLARLTDGLVERGHDIESISLFHGDVPSSLAEYDVIHINNARHCSEKSQRRVSETLEKTVFTVHDYLPLCRARNMLFLNFIECPFLGQGICEDCVPAWYGRQLPQDFYAEAHTVVYPSRKMKSIFERCMKTKGIVIHHGIPIPKLEHQDSNENYVLFTGRVLHEKGIVTLIAAFKNVKAEMPKAKLICSHKGDLETFKELAPEGINFLGGVANDELERLYRGATVIVAPSIWQEPFNLTVLEAYSYAKPVIASNIGAHPELVKHGKTGFLFKPFDDQDLADRIIQLSTDETYTNNLGRNGFRLLKDEFNLEKMVRDYESIFETI